MEYMLTEVYKIADGNGVILKGNIKISRDVNCLIFAHYCKDTLFYKHLFKVTKDIFKVKRICDKNLKEVKKIVKSSGYKKIKTKGVFSVYGDLRSLAVEAGFGKWGENGIIQNDKYGSNFLISAVFYK